MEKAVKVMTDREDYLNMDLINAIIEESDMPFLFLLLRDTGARISEILSIRVKDIKFSNREIILTNLKRKGGKKDIKTNPITERTAKALKDWIEKNNLSERDNIFFKGCGIQNRFKAWRVVKKIGRMFGKNIHPHTFRHSLAVFLVQNGVPLPQVQRILGHSDITTTSFYMRFSSRDVKLSYEKAMEKIDKI